jgi:hypothetical protein
MFGSATTRRPSISKSEMNEQFRFIVESLAAANSRMSFDTLHFKRLRVGDGGEFGALSFGNLFSVAAFRRQKPHRRTWHR